MNGIGDSDPASSLFRDGLLIRARRLFAAYYRVATRDDARLLDALMLAHVGFLIGVSWPRPPVGSPARHQIERDCDLAERMYMRRREAVRACPTFRALAVIERHQIMAILFECEPDGSWVGDD